MQGNEITFWRFKEVMDRWLLYRSVVALVAHGGERGVANAASRRRGQKK